jgi:uncharacterized protein (TIGR03437 family)
MYPFPTGQLGLVCWDIEEDSVNGALFVSAEITPVPQMYRPPFFRSLDFGVTWQDMSGVFPWHVIKLLTDRKERHVYALSEGGGGALYRSANNGESWQLVGRTGVLELLLDKNRPNVIWGGSNTLTGFPDHRPLFRQGGVKVSTNGGATFSPLGPAGIPIFALSWNRSGTQLYAAGHGSGVYVGAASKPRLNTQTIQGQIGGVVGIRCDGCNLLADMPTLSLSARRIPIVENDDYLQFTVPFDFASGPAAGELDVAGEKLRFTLNVSVGPFPVLQGITSVRFEDKKAYAPGELISLFGLQLTGVAAENHGPAHVASNIPWAEQLAEARVILANDDGVIIPGVMLQFAYTSSRTGASQINAQLPYGLPVGRYWLQVRRFRADGTLTAGVNWLSFTVRAVSPTLLGNDVYPVYLQNITQDPTGNTFVSSATPARPGDIITMYATGLGGTSTPVAAGHRPAALTWVAAPVDIVLTSFVEGQSVSTPVQMFASVLSPEFPGLYQISFRVPPEARADDAGLVRAEMRIGDQARAFSVNLSTRP